VETYKLLKKNKMV